MKKKFYQLLLAALLANGTYSFAQTIPLADSLYDMSLEDLMKIDVVSASKEKERLFDAPVAIYSVSRDEISRAGIQSIPEALRLIPGVIVREVNNGNYDIHLRGFDNTARYTFGQNQVNTITLVMINNRPVFNYNAGGTLWESLPVDIADVERIEVVCGPSAPLFGPNAVSGVVNIITRDFKQDQLMVSGQGQGSLSNGSYMGSLAIGKQVSDKLSVGLTGNYQNRYRTDDQQYIFKFAGGGSYIPSKDFRKDLLDKEGLDYKQSLLRKGLNAYASYNPKKDIQFDLSAGLQAAEAQKALFTDITPITYTESNSFYGNLNSKIHNATVRMSYAKGNDELHKMSEYNCTSYDYHILEAAIDYDLKLHSKLRVRPSVGYQYSSYSNLERIKKEDVLGGFFNGEKSIGLISGSLRADYTPLKGLRLVGSGRLDQFNVNSDLYFSYQLASTYSFNEDWMMRAVHGKSYSGIFYNMAYLDLKLSFSPGTINYAKGNTAIKATSNTLSEIGMRGNILSNLQVDLSIFTQTLENVNLLTYVNSEVINNIRYDNNIANNLPYTVLQNGATLSMNWVPNKKLQIKPFVTVQKTETRNFDYYNNPKATGKPYNGQTLTHESTPSVFGGWYINYSPISRLNINTSAYYLGKQLLYHYDDLSGSNGTGLLDSKLNVNAKVSYLAYKKMNVFLGGKNLLSKNSREYYGTDRISSQYFAGVGYNL